MSRRALALLWLVAGCSAASGPVLRLREGDGAPDGSDGTPDGGDGAPDGSDGAEDGGPVGLGRCRIQNDEGFLDQFDGEALNGARWLVAHGNAQVAGERSAGGFLRENVRVEDGKLVLTVRGDRYVGNLRGIDERGDARADGTRIGAAVVTRDLFMSASYQWEGELVGPPGLRLALVAQRNDEAEGFLAYRAPSVTGGAPSYAFGDAQVTGPLGAPRSARIPLPEPLDDGDGHSLRFDWHAGVNPAFAPSVDFWMDAANLQTLEGNAPLRAARMWLVAFVPGDTPAPFDSAEVRIETAFITTLHEVNDQCTDGELAPGILVAP